MDYLRIFRHLVIWTLLTFSLLFFYKFNTNNHEVNVLMLSHKEHSNKNETEMATYMKSLLDKIRDAWHKRDSVSSVRPQPDLQNFERDPRLNVTPGEDQAQSKLKVNGNSSAFENLVRNEWQVNVTSSLLQDVIPSQGVFKKSTFRAKHSHPALSKECYTYANATASNVCCRMHDYMANKEDILTCLRKDYETARKHRSMDFRKESGLWIIVGDSRLRFFFYGIIRKMAGPKLLYRFTKQKNETWQSTDTLVKKNNSFIFRQDMELKHLDVPKMRIVYQWDTMLKELAKRIPLWLKYKAKRPIRLVIGTGAHYMILSKFIFKSKGRIVASQNFCEHLSRLLPNLNSLAKSFPVTFHYVDYFQESKVYPKLKHVWENHNVDYYNGILNVELRSDRVTRWDSNTLLSKNYFDLCEANRLQGQVNSIYLERLNTKDLSWRCDDCVHVGFLVIDQYLNMFLNDACNKYFDFGDEAC